MGITAPSLLAALLSAHTCLAAAPECLVASMGKAPHVGQPHLLQARPLLLGFLLPSPQLCFSEDGFVIVVQFGHVLCSCVA